jgi:peptidoglycan/LPS O-acetylase OafA/YrhL
MRILIPPAFRYFALLLCAAPFIIPATGIMESYPALKANQYQVLTCLFCAGLLLFAFAGKQEHKELWLSARKKALKETLGFLVLIVPVMAFVNRDENGHLDWLSPAGVASAGLSFFTLIATFYFYNDKKRVTAK